MNDTNGYAVFLFPQALEVLGPAIQPFLQDGPTGPHVACNTIDTGGAFVEMTLGGRTPEGKEMSLELMVPSGMIRMVVSTQSEEVFGFGPHRYSKPEPPPLPPLGPTAEPASASPESFPSST
jgi:hypothetical protein